MATPDSPERDILDSSAAGPAAIRGGVIRVAGYAVQILLSVASTALLFRYLGVADSGRYVTVLSLVTIASGIVDFGLTGIGVREATVRDGPARARLLRDLTGLRIALSLLGVAAAVVFAWIAGYPEVMVLGALLAGLGAMAAAAQSVVAVMLTVELRLGWVTVLELLRQVVLVAAIVGLVVAGAGLVAFFATPILAGLIALAASLALVHGRMSFAPSRDWRAWRALLRDVLPFAAATALSAVYFRISMVLLPLVSGAQQTGYFGASFRVVETLLALPNLLVAGAFPILARAARDDLSRLAYATQRLFEISLVAGGWVALMLLVGAPLIIDVVAGSEFAPAAEVLQVQAAALLVVFAGAPLGYALLSLRRHGVLLLLTGLALGLNVLLVPLLASANGAVGAAAATLVAELVLVVGAGVFLGRSDERLRLRFAVPVKAAVAFGAAVAAVTILAVGAGLAIVLATAIYWGLALVLRAVPAEVLIEVRSSAGRLRRAR